MPLFKMAIAQLAIVQINTVMVIEATIALQYPKNNGYSGESIKKRRIVQAYILKDFKLNI